MTQKSLSGNFVKERVRIKDQVRQLVKEHPSALEDYRKLIQYYWYYMDGLNQFIEIKVLETLTQPESITRALRDLVEHGEVTLPEHTRIGRRRQEQQFHDYYGRNR